MRREIEDETRLSLHISFPTSLAMNHVLGSDFIKQKYIKRKILNIFPEDKLLLLYMEYCSEIIPYYLNKKLYSSHLLVYHIQKLYSF